MRLSVPTLLVVIIVYSILLGVIFFFLDKYLDMRVVSYSVDMTRQAMNLLNNILNTGEGFLVVDIGNLGSILPYIDVPEYDYNLTIRTVGGRPLYSYQKNIKFFDFTSGCYYSYQLMKGYAELPVVIKEDGKRIPGIARLELVRTPISELAFWISQGSFRVEEGFDEEVVKLIRAEFDELYFNGDGEICMKDIGRGPACKSFTNSSVVKLCGGVECRGYSKCNILEVIANETGIFVNKVKEK